MQKLQARFVAELARIVAGALKAVNAISWL
jgi:hypothetical protein